LNHGAGWIKVLSGEIEGNIAKAPNYSGEVLCHIHLEAGRKFLMKARKGVDYAAFLLANTAIVNYRGFQAGDLVAFNSLGEIIEIINDGGMTIDVILFGGEPYSEGIVAEGSFVMNTPHEITQAYNDYYDGKYGQVFQ
jgi:redox-sensitive bicupin YhaK (pirin superfamily)